MKKLISAQTMKKLVGGNMNANELIKNFYSLNNAEKQKAFEEICRTYISEEVVSNRVEK